MTEPVFLNGVKLREEVYVLSPMKWDFEKAYLQTRKKEGWLLDNGTVKNLPRVEKRKPNWKMWRMRQDSSTKVCSYLKTKNIPLNILEVGCGNGWFSNCMKKSNSSANVFGLDINLTELKQGAEVFKEENIFWLYADLFEAKLPEKYFDVIVLNASVQYFNSLQNLLQRLSVLVKDDGELHLLDSPFYAETEIASAKNRSEKYFESTQSTEMRKYYHHHSWSEMKKYSPQILYRPNKLLNKIFSVFGIYRSPFYWLLIKKLVA